MRTPTAQGMGRRQLALAGALILFGLVLLVVAVVRLASGGSDDGEASAEGDGSTASRPCVPAPCRANDDPRPARGYEVPSVAVDPKNPDHIVVGDDNLVGGQCGWHVTFNGGRDWQDGVFERPPGFRNCQLDSGGYVPMGNVTMGPSGNVYAVFTSGQQSGERPAGGESLLLSVSTDGGRTFPPARVAVRGAAAGVGYTRPALTAAAGPSGTDQLLLSFWSCQFTQRPSRCDKIMFARSTDGGQSFSPAVVASEPPGGSRMSRPVIGPDGTIHLLFLREFDQAAGETQLVLAQSKNGTKFSATVIDRQPNIGSSPNSAFDPPKLALGPAPGNLYAVFADRREGDPRVFFRRSTDNGATWGDAVALNRARRGSYFNPNISVAPNGRIDVVFYQRVGENLDNVLWTFSTDGGATFAPDRRLNHFDRPISREIGYWGEVFDIYAPGVSSSDGLTALAWSDTRLGNRENDTQDTFIRRIEYDQSGRPRDEGE